MKLPTMEKTNIIINQHWWRNFRKKTKAVFRLRATCQHHNTEKTVTVGHCQEAKPQGPYEDLQMGYPAFTLHGTWVCLVIVCLFPGWVEAFCCWKATPFLVTRKLLDFVFPTWGIPTFISSDWGTHSTETFIKELGKVSSLIQKLQFLERSKGGIDILKLKLAKPSETLRVHLATGTPTSPCGRAVLSLRHIPLILQWAGNWKTRI